MNYDSYDYYDSYDSYFDAYDSYDYFDRTCFVSVLNATNQIWFIAVN